MILSVLFLILVFCDTSGLLLLLGLDFFAMIFLLGAIAVSFLFVVMIPRKWILRGAKFLLKKIIAYFLVLLIAPVLWDWGLDFLSLFVVFYEEFINFLLSSMERLPLSVGGGGSDAGPSRRPLPDLNSTPDPEASPSGNAKPYQFQFGDRDGRLPPDPNEEPPTPHVNPSYEEISHCINEEASLSERDLPAPDGVSKALRSLLESQKLPDLNESLSPEKEEEKEALVNHILQKSADYLKIKEELVENAFRKLKNRKAFAQCENFLRLIPDYISDREKKRAREDSDYDYDE